MDAIQADSAQKRTRILKIILWILTPSLLLIIPLISILLTDELTGSAILSLILGIISLILFISISVNYYKWPLILFIIFSIGLFFKSMHWPFTGVLLTLSTLSLTLVSIVIIVRLLVRNKQKQFIRWFGITTGMVTIFTMCGWLTIIMHWNVNGLLLVYIGSLVFILSVLAIVFTLPNTNYFAWTSYERKIFFRVIIIPMAFLFVFITLSLVFSDVFNSIMGVNDARWVFDGIELFNLEGITKQ